MPEKKGFQRKHWGQRVAHVRLSSIVLYPVDYFCLASNPDLMSRSVLFGPMCNVYSKGWKQDRLPAGEIGEMCFDSVVQSRQSRSKFIFADANTLKALLRSVSYENE